MGEFVVDAFPGGEEGGFVGRVLVFGRAVYATSPAAEPATAMDLARSEFVTKLRELLHEAAPAEAPAPAPAPTRAKAQEEAKAVS